MKSARPFRLQIAEEPVSHATVDNSRNLPGRRFREARQRIPEGIPCRLLWKDFYGNEHTGVVKDLSRFGCRAIVQDDSLIERVYIQIAKAQVDIDGMTAYTGPMRIVNERRESDGSMSIGVTFEGQGCDLDALAAAAGIRSLTIGEELDRITELSALVRPEFKVLIADFNAMLHEVSQKLQVEEARIQQMSHSDNYRIRLEERVISAAQSMFAPKLQGLLAEFQSIVSKMSSEEEVPHKAYFRLSFQSLIEGTPFMERGLKKPLGYSGDYGLMVMLYEYGDLGQTLFHRFFHRFVCFEPAAVANRNRVGFLSDILLNEYNSDRNRTRYSVASIACGPAREIYEFLSLAKHDLHTPIKLVLVDLEEHALDYAQHRLRELGIPKEKVELIFLKEDVVSALLTGRDLGNWLKDTNVILSAGLFDYLTDRVSTRMIQAMYDFLKPGGQILIGNISKRSPDVFAMDYFMDWRLILRDEPDLFRLVSSELRAKGCQADVIAESLGLNLFLRVKRSS